MTFELFLAPVFVVVVAAAADAVIRTTKYRLPRADQPRPRAD